MLEPRPPKPHPHLRSGASPRSDDKLMVFLTQLSPALAGLFVWPVHPSFSVAGVVVGFGFAVLIAGAIVDHPTGEG
jgi:hypothetical protein